MQMQLVIVATLLAGAVEAAVGHIGPRTADEYAARYDLVQQSTGSRGSAQGLDYPLPKADAICEGFIWFDDRDKIRIGEKDIDWAAKQYSHKEICAQLNRFFMLDRLGHAWNATHQEKYAARARVLIEDWIAFMEKHQWKFLDPYWLQDSTDNPLNAAARLNNFLRAMALFRQSSSFDDALCAKMLAAMEKQYDMLMAQTSIGYGNWPIAQAHALLYGGLVLDFHPKAKTWREHGLKVLSGCYALSFRPDGTFIENTPGYHDWVTSQRAQDFLLKRRLMPDMPFDCTRETLLKSFAFTSLARSFSMNDSSYCGDDFRHEPETPWLRTRISGDRWLGVKDWQQPQRMIFPDAKIVFGGDGNEVVLFDASEFSSGHMHHAALMVGFIADGFNLLGDPGIPTYSRATPDDVKKRRYSNETYSHATVNFNHATQNRVGTSLLTAAVAPDYTYAVGEFNGGHTTANWSNTPPNRIDIDADFRRMILHFPKHFLLVFDNTQVRKGDQVATNYAWPVIPHAKWTLDQEKLRFFTRDEKLPNLLIQLVGPPQAAVSATCDEGKNNPMRGWISPHHRLYLPAPLLEFSAAGGDRKLCAVTLLKAFPKDGSVPDVKVLQSAPGVLDLSFPDGSRSYLRWSEDFIRAKDLEAADVKAQAAVLTVLIAPDGKKNVWVGRELKRGPIDGLEYFTGWK